MVGQREVILIGLGDFGKSVSDNLVHMIEERKFQLGDTANSVVLHTINFENDNVFHSTDYMTKILDTVSNSSAKKQGDKFSFIFVGDLFESGTSKYAVDFAYLPYLLEMYATLNHGEVLGFFTFASEIGVSEKVGDEPIGLICKHFQHLMKINESDSYYAPFPDIQGHKFNEVKLPKGPFERNYVVVTPGRSEIVSKETGVVFAERIFYELYYLAPRFNELSTQWAASLRENENSDKNLSCFSMVQIPRINEIQKYYLKYLLENKIMTSFLSEPLKGTDEEFYLEKFFNMIEVPYKNSEFPMDRAVRLFVNRYKEKFTHILNYYVNGKNKDFKEYIEDCKKRIDDIVSELRPRYDDFSSEEINYLFGTMKTGFENLFKLNRISGNIKTYISFIEKLKSCFENWSVSIEKYTKASEIYNLEDSYKAAEKKIIKLQKKKIFSFLPFIPIRKKLIENAILSIPVEKYLDSLIKQKLAESMLTYWNELLRTKKNPISECQKLIDNLQQLQNRLDDKNQYLQNKIQFIENMNNSYYIIPMFDVEDDYTKLLGRIKDRNFGPQNQKKIKDTIANAFKLWTSDKDLFAITQNPTEFINFIENDFVEKYKDVYSDIEEDAEKFSSFSKKAVMETKHKTETLNENSFQTVDSYLFENKMMLVPKMEAKDSLHDEIESNFELTEENKITIPNDFTLGSIVYFQDYLFMSQQAMKKKEFLESYQDVSVSECCYDTNQTVVSKNKDDEPISSYQIIRAILLFYMEEEQSVSIYNSKFGTNEKSLNDDQIETLSKSLSLEETIKKIDDEHLISFVKDRDIPLKTDRSEQEKLILYTLKNGQ